MKKASSHEIQADGLMGVVFPFQKYLPVSLTVFDAMIYRLVNK